MDHVPGVRQRAERGELCAGTVDSWLIWNLTGGKAHVTDYSNASRTMLFNIYTLQWDPALCAALDIPMDLLPEPKSNSEVYGHLASGLPGLEDLAGIPVCGSAGDQQSALFGQACFTPGQAKNTYGTGCFTLLNVGDTPVRSRSGLVTSVGWQVAGKTVYALEGSVFNAGSTIQWLRDELGLIQSAPECDRLAESVPDSGGVVVVPAFTGLGAPYWDMYARGTIVGLTRGSTKAHIARAVLECIAYQTADLVRVMNADAPCPLTELRVDGGPSAIFSCRSKRICCGCRWTGPLRWRPPPSARRRWRDWPLACGTALTSWQLCAAASACSVPSGKRKRVWRIWPAGIGRWSAPGVGLKTMCERCCVFEKREVY